MKYENPPSNYDDQRTMLLTNSIIVWRFRDAPEFLKKLSDNGGDEDWLALVPESYRDKDGFLSYINWVESSGFDTCCEPQEIPLLKNHWVPAKEGDPVGRTVFIGSHA